MFPDNDNREARLEQLMNQTSTIQAFLGETHDQINKTDAETEKTVAKLAQAAGYPTVEAYCEAGMNIMSKADKANYEHLCKSLAKYNIPEQRAKFAFSVIGSVGLTLEVALPKVVATFCKMGAFLHGMKGIIKGLWKMITGAVEEGMQMVRTFATLIKANWSRALTTGGAGADLGLKAASRLSWVTKAGKFMKWAGLFADLGILIYEIVDGAQKRDALQQGIKEACSSRFSAKKMEVMARNIQVWNSKVAGIINAKHMFQDKMKDQETDHDLSPAMKITQEMINKDMQKSINKLIGEFETDMEAEQKDEEKVLKSLKDLDSNETSGPKGWTNEDPDLATMKQWIADHPARDKDGKPVNLAGPNPTSAGLVWTAGNVQSSTEKGVVSITAKNQSATDGQHFKALEVFVPVGDKSGDTKGKVFVGDSLTAAHTTHVTDVTVELVAGTGVVGISPANLEIKMDDKGELAVKIWPSSGSHDILVGPGASFEMKLTGSTGAAGAVAGLTWEEWLPYKDQAWHDITITKT